ncbi:hypothetical protein [Pseudarthrobacter sp. BRE9]|nr:hypothetical protein [Pseudarthrobacter sp. BRE9]MDT0168504.1 hypothetical protein [Pseudarthrobacter sp. BRE9]
MADTLAAHPADVTRRRWTALVFISIAQLMVTWKAQHSRARTY